MSAFANPIVLSKTNQPTVLNRIPLTIHEGTFSEKCLQEVLFKHPECLPTKELDPRIGNLIPICMELETGAGPADILYVTETGHLVLVETKLWRNPEARRVVVAQILDYAKQLTNWTFTDLMRETAIATKQGSDYFLSCVRKANPDIDEASFVDGVSNSLKSGDFLLLIVGDGIRSGTESLVNFISQYGNLRFGFGLIEVAAFKLPNDDLMLTPRILAKTEILERTVVIGRDGNASIEETAQVEDAEINLELGEKRKWYQDFWSGYLQILKLDDLNQPLPISVPKSSNVFFSMPTKVPGEAWISAYIAQSANECGVYLTFSKSFERASEYVERVFSEKESIEKTIGEALNWSKDGKKVYISSKFNYADINDPNTRNKVQEYLADMTNKMINAFRHRIESFAKEEK